MEYITYFNDIYNVTDTESREELRKVSYQLFLIEETCYQLYDEYVALGLRGELENLLKDKLNDYMTFNEVVAIVKENA